MWNYRKVVEKLKDQGPVVIIGSYKVNQATKSIGSQVKQNNTFTSDLGTLGR